MRSIEKHHLNVQVHDVTDDKVQLKAALQMAAGNYARLASSHPTVDEVFHELCDDKYHRAGWSRTFLAMGHNPNTNQVEPLGTGRLIIGDQNSSRSGLLPLEIMRLMEPKVGWHRFQLDGCVPTNAAEAGRFAVSERCRKGLARERGLHLTVLRRLFETFLSVSRDHGRQQLWGIMPRYVTKVCREAGFELDRMDDVKLRHRENMSLFRKYDRYWIHNQPSLYRIQDSPQCAPPRLPVADNNASSLMLTGV